MKPTFTSRKALVTFSTLALLFSTTLPPQALAVEQGASPAAEVVEVPRNETDLPASDTSGYDSDEGSALPPTGTLEGETPIAAAASVSGWSPEEMRAYGLSQGIGAATGGRTGIGEGYWSMAFQNGVVVYSPGAGNLVISHQVYNKWLTKERANWGRPQGSQQTSTGLTTTFTGGAFVFDPASQLIRQANKLLSSGDILAIGDSQVWDRSWVGYGIRNAGYKDVMFRCGGVGYIASRPGECSSYSGGVIHNEWYLPLGKPRAIYIQGSGNDVWTGQGTYATGEAARSVVRKLKQAYPGTQIIMTDVFSTHKAAHNARAAMGDRLNQIAREEGVTFMSVKYWVSDFNAQYMLDDDVHLQDRYQADMGRNFTEPFKQALAGNTVVGAIYGYYSTTGNSAKYGAVTSNERASRDGGAYQTTAKNYALYWSPREGTHAVWFNGAIGSLYRASGYENGSGYPLTDEEAYLYGARQQFRLATGQTTTYLWSPQFGVHKIWESGGIAAKYRAMGYAERLGFPVESETVYAYGVRQTFQTASGQQTRIYWAPNTGAQAMNGRGDIFATWVRRGHATTVGFPSSGEVGVPGGSTQFFRAQGGQETIALWSAGTGTKFMNPNGAFYNWYKANGFTQRVGFPTTDEHLGSDGRYHVYFSSGRHLTWSEREGLRVAS